jgi:hypothetical protein
MKISESKTAAISIAIFLIISMGAATMLIPATSAHQPSWTTTPTAYIVAAPDPIGVGQRVTVYTWLDTVFGAGASLADSAALTNTFRFHNYNLTVVKPDGTAVTTIFPVVSDPTSSQYSFFTPDQVGNYTFLFNFPGQPYNDSVAGDYNPTSILVGDYYTAASAMTTLTVQQESIPGPTGSSPLPTAFWERPIYGNNNDWFTISSNWLGTGSAVNSATGSGTLSGYNSASFFQVYPGDAVGPTTGHVMWTYPLMAGGVVGGTSTAGKLGDTYNEGSAYLQKFTNVIILNGYIYYRQPIGTFSGSGGAEVCQNLATGQIVWTNPTMPTISFGYIYDHQDPNQHGVQSGILFSSFGGTITFGTFVIPLGNGEAFDAATGDFLFNMTNAPSGSAAMGPSGEQLKYVFANDGTAQNPSWSLREWNSSKLWNYLGIGASGGNDILTPTLYNSSSTNVPSTSTTTTTGVATSAITAITSLVSIPTLNPTLTGAYTPYTGPTYLVNAGINNANSPFDRFDWNISVPWLNVMGNQTLTTLTNGTVVYGASQYSTPPTNPDASQAFTVLATFYDNMMICRNGSYSSGTPQTFATQSVNPYTYFAVDLNTTHSTFGQILWTNTVQPAGNLTVTFAGADPTTNTFAESYQQTTQFVGYSMLTGAKIWGPTASQAAFDYYGNPIYPFIASVPAYGMLYSSSYAGIVYANSMVNGSLMWTYGNGGAGNSTLAGFDTPYGDYPTGIQAIGNGVIYLATTEHTVNSPIYKGCLARAINATTGAEIWTLSNDNNEFAAMSYAIADGYAVMWNGYDNSIYSVGRGPSATTVSASPVVSSFGDNVIIQGTVTDISAGTQQSQLKADFPSGVPVASDASMASLMEYVYQQQPHPTNFTGVPVSVYVLDSNGNYRQIGTTTTDLSGSYSLAWKPDISGSYTVYAIFAGTNGYWPSTSETALNIMEAHPTIAPTPTAAPSVADQYFVPSIVGIIVAIIIVGVVLALLMLRKKP